MALAKCGACNRNWRYDQCTEHLTDSESTCLYRDPVRSERELYRGGDLVAGVCECCEAVRPDPLSCPYCGAQGELPEFNYLFRKSEGYGVAGYDVSPWLPPNLQEALHLYSLVPDAADAGGIEITLDHHGVADPWVRRHYHSMFAHLAAIEGGESARSQWLSRREAERSAKRGRSR